MILTGFAIFMISMAVTIMVNMLMHMILHIMRVNHYRLPQLDWKFDVIKFLIVLMIITPIVGFLTNH